MHAQSDRNRLFMLLLSTCLARSRVVDSYEKSALLQHNVDHTRNMIAQQTETWPLIMITYSHCSCTRNSKTGTAIELISSRHVFQRRFDPPLPRPGLLVLDPPLRPPALPAGGPLGLSGFSPVLRALRYSLMGVPSNPKLSLMFRSRYLHKIRTPSRCISYTVN